MAGMLKPISMLSISLFRNVLVSEGHDSDSIYDKLVWFRQQNETQYLPEIFV